MARITALKGRSPLSAKEIVDEYFIENRTRLLEIAAFLDRLDRADPSYAGEDFRMKAFADALAGASQGAGRLERLQLLFSDPTTEPIGVLDRKSAFGAYDRWKATGANSQLPTPNSQLPTPSGKAGPG